MKSVRVIRNAHHVLGLPTGVDISSIKKRASHLLNLARIEETEQYETDIPGVVGLRSEQNIRKALEKLTAVKSRLIESFFWFETSTIQDHKSLKELINGNFEIAQQYWNGLSNRSPNWIAKKNEALAYFISSYQTGNVELFEKSLFIWREIAVSDQFWTFYQEHYKITDDLGTNEKSFDEIRINIFEYLSCLTLDLFRKHENPSIVKVFFAETEVVGLCIEDHILNLAVLKIQDHLTSLDQSSKNDIRLRTAKLLLMSSLKELSKFGTDEYSPIKALRENCASKLRSISIEINNETRDYVLAKEFLDAGIELSNSDSYLLLAERDKSQLAKNHEFDNFTEIVLKGSKGYSAKAKWQTFKNEESKLSLELKKESGFINFKKRIVVEYALEKLSINVDAVNKKSEYAGEQGMSSLYYEMWELIEIFNLNHDYVQDIVNKCIQRTRTVSAPEQVHQIDKDLAEVWQIASDSNVDEESKLAFVILCRAAIWKEFAPYVKRLRYGSYLTTAGWFTVWFNGFGIIFWIAAYLYRRKKF